MYNGFALVVTFFITRVVTISLMVAYAAYSWWELGYVSGLYWSRPRSDRVLFGGLTALLVVHWGLNIHWFTKIVAHAKRAARIGTTPASSPKHKVNGTEKPKNKGRLKAA